MAKRSIAAIEERERAIELMMLRSASPSTIYRFAQEQWGVGHETIDSVVRKIAQRWRQEWLDDPDRIRLRSVAIKSLEHARDKLHEIIQQVRRVPVSGKTGAFKRFYRYGPRDRLNAIRTLAVIERELARIGGYSDPDVLIDARNVVVDPTNVKTIDEQTSGAVALIANPSAFENYFASLARDGIVEGQVVQEERHAHHDAREDNEST